MILFEFQTSVKNYRIDLYLLDQKLAIEVDEHVHADRDVQYEQTREQVTITHASCKFLGK